MEPIVYAVIGIAIIAFICYVLVVLVPMPEPFPKIIIAAAVILVLLWLLNSFGVFHMQR